MKHFIALAVIVAYVVAVNVADLNIASTFWMAVVYLFVPIVGLPLIVYTLFAALARRGNVADLRTTVQAGGFAITHELPSILIDSKTGRIACYEHLPDGGFRHWLLDRKQILGTSVVKDGGSVTSTSTSSLLGRALVGGVVLGGVGAILGGLTAKSETSARVKKLVLEVVLDCPDHPVHRIAYLDLPEGAPVGGIVVKAAVEKVEFAHALLEMMMMGESLPQATTTQDLQDTLRMLKLQASRQ